MFPLEKESVLFLILCLREFDPISANDGNCKQLFYCGCFRVIMSVICVFGGYISFEISNNL